MKKDSLEGLVGRYLDLKSKQVEDEVTQMVKGKDEKIKADEVFDIPNNREIFINFRVDEPETALLWLRRNMDKL
jgi:hypothetical protein